MEGINNRSNLLMVIFAALITREVFAAQHLVGGSQGWDESTDFNSWASSQTFKIGDQLVFKYSPLHSVVELPSESAYKSCDLGNVLDSKNSGSDIIKLNKVGTRYFACGTSGHCSQGMKLKVTTVPASSSPSTTSTTTPAASSSSTSNTASQASFPASFSHAGFFLLAYLLVF